jgi:hypothetical protein
MGVKIEIQVTRSMRCDMSACDRERTEEPRRIDLWSIPDDKQDLADSLKAEEPGGGWYFLWSAGTSGDNPFVVCPQCADVLRELPEDDRSGLDYWRHLLLEQGPRGRYPL